MKANKGNDTILDRWLCRVLHIPLWVKQWEFLISLKSWLCSVWEDDIFLFLWSRMSQMLSTDYRTNNAVFWDVFFRQKNKCYKRMEYFPQYIWIIPTG